MMATKDQERAALKKIRKIVEDLGEDSYIATAFEGCFEDAEQNIDLDTAFSMKCRCQKAEKDLDDLAEENKKLVEENAYLEKEKEKLLEEKSRGIELREQYRNQCTENWNKFREQEDRAEALEQEVIRLKAKLYDLIAG